jgi:hypothetical protein
MLDKNTHARATNVFLLVGTSYCATENGLHPRKIILIRGQDITRPRQARIYRVSSTIAACACSSALDHPTRVDRSLGPSMNKRLPERWNYVRALLRQLAKG